jgi:hypothetical protein
MLNPVFNNIPISLMGTNRSPGEAQSFHGTRSQKHIFVVIIQRAKGVD